MLTSFAIRNLSQAGHAVAFYFCQFSQPCDREADLLRIFAAQLFEVYFKRKLPVEEDLGYQVLSSSDSPEELQALIRELVINLAPTFFEIDGVDEAEGNAQLALSNVLKFLFSLSDELPGKVRLWCSKRVHVRPVEWYEKMIQPRKPSFLNITDHTEADVVRFLQARFAALQTQLDADMDGGLSDKDRMIFKLARQYILLRARGNFLWARLITQHFDGEERVSDVLELLERVLLSDQPEEIDNLYHNIFRRIKVEDRKTAR